MKIYTKTGDMGQTGLYGGTRVPKSDLRLHAYGTIDELNSHIGLALAFEVEQPCGIGLAALLTPIAHELFVVGSHISTPYADANSIPPSLPPFNVHAIARLEEQIDILTAQLPPLTTFILPGGSIVASQLHVCRTVCRRAERIVVELALLGDGEGKVQGAFVLPGIIVYLNRLSDFFFTLSRAVNHSLNIQDTVWKK